MGKRSKSKRRSAAAAATADDDDASARDVSAAVAVDGPTVPDDDDDDGSEPGRTWNDARSSLHEDLLPLISSPEEMLTTLLLEEERDGDDGDGGDEKGREVGLTGTKAPWDRHCYKIAGESDASGGGFKGTAPSEDDRYWRVMLFPRRGTWAYGDAGTLEAPLDVGNTKPQDLEQCQLLGTKAESDAIRPYAQGISFWWGTSEVTVWTGLPPTTPEDHEWKKVEDAAAWDHSVLIGGSMCPVAQDVDSLAGQREFTQHALWGLRGCSAESFVRLSPETATLDSLGWKKVVDEDFNFGVEVFIRRLLQHQGMAVADEVCMREVIDNLWENRNTMSFADMKSELDDSRCMQKIEEFAARMSGNEDTASQQEFVP